MKITGEKVKEAASLLKLGKADVSEGFCSDAILNGPDILFDQLACVYRSWCVHGTVTPTLLACAFLPLLKSSLKDPADTGSYRAIAGSSLILKLFDKVVLLLWGHLLSTDSLQFGYKVGTSTTQCSWLVTEVASHFLRLPVGLHKGIQHLQVQHIVPEVAGQRHASHCDQSDCQGL
jgi:hypothetical protein